MQAASSALISVKKGRQRIYTRHIGTEESRLQFHSIDPRPFVTVEADLTDSEDPTQKLCDKIEKAIKPGCVMRVRYKVNQEQLAEVDEDRC